MMTNTRLSAAGRIAFDFIMGVGVFAFVAGLVAQGHGSAFADATVYGSSEAGPWLTTVAYAHEQSGIGWHPLTRDAAILLLAVSFGAITAFNLAVVRHLKAVASPNAATNEPSRNLDGPHINA